MKKSRTVRPTAGVESPTTRRLSLVELLIDTEAELFDLAVRSGLQVLDAMLEEDRTAICGPRYAHQADRTASRAGTVASTVVLGGRKVSIRRPRVRSGRGMRAITKRPEPVSLTAHRQTLHSNYGNYEAKDVLRDALFAEQRGLCCYCMSPRPSAGASAVLGTGDPQARLSE